MASEGHNYNYAILIANKIKNHYINDYVQQYHTEDSIVLHFQDISVTIDYDCQSFRIHRQYDLILGIDLTDVYDHFTPCINMIINIIDNL